MFVERDDAEVLHEPFSHAYYHGPDRLSDRFGDVAPRPEHAYKAVAVEVSAPREGWSDWHRDAEHSAGIAPPAAAPAALPRRGAAMVELCHPRYERLHAARLPPEPPGVRPARWHRTIIALILRR